LREHPTPSDLEDFLKGLLSGEKARGVIRHLALGCVTCTGEVRQVRARLVPGSTPDEDAVYTEILERAQRSALHLDREAARAREITPMLIHGGLMAVVREADLPLSGFAMYLALLDASWAVRYESPREMVSLARAAVEVASKLDTKRYGARPIYDLQTRAWGELANALRVADDLDESERAYGMAFELLLQGSGDPYVKVRLYDLHASFLGTRRRFGLAFSALDVVVSLYLDLGERHLAGRALIIKAMYSHYSGQPEVALRLSREGISFLDKSIEPELTFLAAHNRILFLGACGRFREAKKELFLHRSDLNNVEGRVNQLKLRWLQAQVSAGLEEWESAEVAFLEAKEGFEAAGMRFHAALASLDLSLLWVRWGRLREAEDLGSEAADVFLALGIQREALGCVMVLKDAFKKRKATVVLLESVVEFLRQTQIDPDACFTPRFE
jgi:tetratricopeptide (TPR) repeat protein